MGWKRLLLLDLVLLSLTVLASRAALLIHELGGHALPALAFGAERIEAEFSFFGGGWVHHHFPAGVAPSPFGAFVISLGGIVLNALTGAAAWIAARRWIRSRGPAYLFLLFLGAGSLGAALCYLGNGLYYGTGDPVGFVPVTQDISGIQWMWTFTVPALAVVAGYAAKGWLDSLAAFASVETSSRRFGWTAATVGASTAVYLGLWLATWNVEVDFTLRELRLEQEVAKEVERRIEASESAKKETPTPPSTAPTIVVVRPEEVEERVPPPMSTLALLFAGAAGAFAALWKVRPSVANGEIRGRTAFLLAACAMTVVAALAFLGR